MSMSLLEVLNDAGYNLDNLADARWFLSKQTEFTELVEKTEKTVEEYEEELRNEDADE